VSPPRRTVAPGDVRRRGRAASWRRRPRQIDLSVDGLTPRRQARVLLGLAPSPSRRVVCFARVTQRGEERRGEERGGEFERTREVGGSCVPPVPFVVARPG
jgi:hypothetical protein